MFSEEMDADMRNAFRFLSGQSAIRINGSDSLSSLLDSLHTNAYENPSFTPATEETINELKKSIVENLSCTVCLEDEEDRTEAITLPCNHSFHVNCITSWLRTNNICPLCREDVGETNGSV